MRPEWLVELYEKFVNKYMKWGIMVGW